MRFDIEERPHSFYITRYEGTTNTTIKQSLSIDSYLIEGGVREALFRYFTVISIIDEIQYSTVIYFYFFIHEINYD
jgi:hypothetical protein